MWKSIWDWVEHNRFTVVLPVLIAAGWLVAVGCTPETTSPVSDKLVTADQLAIEYESVIAKFDLAATDLERQYEQQEMVTQALTQLATGGVTDWGGMVNLLIAGGGAGLLFDNRRKDTVLKSMKRGTKVT